MDPILTQSELDALLQPTEGESTRAVREVDLVARDHQAMALLSELQVVANRLAFAVERLCARYLKVPCHAKADPVEVLPATRLPELIGNPRYIYSLNADDEPSGIIAVDAFLGSTFMVCSFGGEIETGIPEDQPPATATERRIVFRLATEFTRALEKAIAPISRRKITTIVEAPTRPPSAAAVLVLIRVTIGEQSGFVVAALSTEAAGFKPPKPSCDLDVDALEKSPMYEEMMEVGVNVSAILGHAEMTMRDFLNLKVGTIVVLDTSVGANVPLLIEGIPRFSGSPVLNRGNLSLKINGSVEELDKE